MNDRKKLLIMAAGTGGHIFPGLAIASTMQREGWEVSWLGTRHGMEGNIVPSSGIENGPYRICRIARQRHGSCSKR